MFARFFAKVRAWLVLTRGSNLPTVWSNLVAGWLLGYAYTDRFPWALGLLASFFGLLLGVSLIYVGGMILVILMILVMEYTGRSQQHGAKFYRIICTFIPVAIAGIGSLAKPTSVVAGTSLFQIIFVSANQARRLLFQ